MKCLDYWVWGVYVNNERYILFLMDSLVSNVLEYVSEM